MEKFRMKPFSHTPDLCVVVPGSKSITNRALMIAALAHGTTTLKGILFSDDSRVFMEALKNLGFSLDIREADAVVTVTGCGGQIPKREASVYVGSAGTAARFLTAMLALSGGTYEMTCSEQMKARPMRPLLEALELLGAQFLYREKPYAFPFLIRGREMPPMEPMSPTDSMAVPLNIDKSSQFLSALLLAGVLHKDGFRIRLTGTRDARSYVGITMKMMQEFGAGVQMCGKDEYEVLPGQAYKGDNLVGSPGGREYQIEPDVSAACYFYAMAAVHGGRAQVRYVHPDSSQGDIHFLDVLQQMGCSWRDTPEGIVLNGPVDKVLSGGEFVMSDFSDQTMTLAAIAPFAAEPVIIRGVSHIRLQESNRIEAIVTELTRLGISCQELEDGVRIESGSPKGTEIQTYHDHRMAMAFAVVGTKVPGVVIDNPLCCQKTFENYFAILTNLDLSLE